MSLLCTVGIKMGGEAGGENFVDPVHWLLMEGLLFLIAKASSMVSFLKLDSR